MGRASTSKSTRETSHQTVNNLTTFLSKSALLDKEIGNLKGETQMGYQYHYIYTPTYPSSFQDSIASLCKNILPFSLKKRLLQAPERKLLKQQSDHLKWQQNSFHQILNLMALQREGIAPETEVSAFRSHLLETLIVSRPDHGHEQPTILRDKLIFLQELLHAKCISSEEYHASKRPLLQRLALQGAEIDARDLIVGAPSKETTDEEWSVIDLRDEPYCLLNKENSHSHSKNKTKHVSAAFKQIKGAAAASVMAFKSSLKHGKSRRESSIFDHPSTTTTTNHQKNTVYDAKISKVDDDDDEGRCIGENPFWNNHHWNQKENNQASSVLMPNGKVNKKDGDGETYSEVEQPMSHGVGPDTKQIKSKLHPDGSASDFFIDKVLAEKIKEELSRIQEELSSTNPYLHFSRDQMEAISTRLPVDKADLKKFFPKSWCDRYGDVVLDVVKKEFKEHVGEMGSRRITKQEKLFSGSRKWSAYEDDENHHPNLF